MATQVEDQNPRNQYTATAGQTVFPYTFLTYFAEDLSVVKNGVTLALTTDYTISDVGNINGGDVTLTAGAAVGDKITIFRDMEFNRTTDYVDSGDFLADVVDQDFNRLWLAAQENRSKLGNVLQVAEDDDLTNINLPMDIPSKADRRLKALGFDGEGNPVAVDVVTSDASDASQINYINLKGEASDVQTEGSELEQFNKNVALKFGTITQTAPNTYEWSTTAQDVTAVGVGMLFGGTIPVGATNTGPSTIAIKNYLGNTISTLTILMDAALNPPAAGDLKENVGYQFIAVSGFAFIATASMTVPGLIGDDSIPTSGLQDGAVTLPKLASGTPGFTQTYDNIGQPQEEAYRQWFKYAESGQLTSGTDYDFIGIPNSATKIELFLREGTLSAGTSYAIEAGGASFITTGYKGQSTDAVNYVSWEFNPAVLGAFATVTSSANWNTRACVLKVVLEKEDGDFWSIKSSATTSSNTANNSEQSLGYVEIPGGSIERVKLRTGDGVSTFTDGYATLKYYGNPNL